MDYECKAHACVRREAEMQATIDALRERVAGLEAKAARLDGAPRAMTNGYDVWTTGDMPDLPDWRRHLLVALVPVEEGDAK